MDPKHYGPEARDQRNVRTTAESGTLRIVLAGPGEPLIPGWLGICTLDIENRGVEPECYEILVDGVPTEWIKLSAGTVALEPGASRRLEVTVRVPSAVGDKAGRHELAVRVASTLHRGTSAQASTPVTVLAPDRLELTLDPQRSAKAFTVRLRSGADRVRIYRFSGADFEGGLSYSFSPPEVALAGGEEAAVQLQVDSRSRPLFGLRQVRRFQVVATPQLPGLTPTKTTGQFLATPRVSLLLVGLVILLVFAAIAGATFGLPLVCEHADLPICPRLTATLSAEPEVVSVGGNVRLAWEAANAAEVLLLPDPGEVEATGLYTATVYSSTVYTLRATGSRGEVVEAEALVAAEGMPPAVVRFEVVPDSFVEGEVEEVTLSWAAPGAEYVSISGVEGEYAAAGSVSTSAPGRTERYTLVAANSEGSVSKEAFVTVLPSEEPTESGEEPAGPDGPSTVP